MTTVLQILHGILSNRLAAFLQGASLAVPRRVPASNAVTDARQIVQVVAAPWMVATVAARNWPRAVPMPLLYCSLLVRMACVPMPTSIIVQAGKLVRYCGVECQAKGWKRLGHKQSCGSVLPTPAAIQASKDFAQLIGTLRQFGYGSLEVAVSCCSRLVELTHPTIGVSKQVDGIFRYYGLNPNFSGQIVVAACEAGLIPAIAAAMQAHPRSHPVQINGACMLGSAFNGCPPNRASMRSECSKHRVVALAIRTMRSYATHLSIVCSS